MLRWPLRPPGLPFAVAAQQSVIRAFFCARQFSHASILEKGCSIESNDSQEKRMGRNAVTLCMLALLFGTFLGCDRKPEVKGPRMGTRPQAAGVPVYHFAVHPLHNPGKLTQAYQPLVDYLNGRLQGARLVLEASRDYANFEEKYQARKPDFLLPNPWQTLQAMQAGYRVIAMAGEPQELLQDLGRDDDPEVLLDGRAAGRGLAPDGGEPPAVGRDHVQHASGGRPEHAVEDVAGLVGGGGEEGLLDHVRKLTGRHLELAVTPLNFGEYLGFRGVKMESNKLWMAENRNLLYNHAFQYLQIGGFPKIVLTRDELLRKELLAQYFNDILTKDIRDRYKLKEAGKLKNLALFFAANFTRPYTFRKVKALSEIPLSLDTIHRFSHYLENSFLVDFLSRFSYSLKNRMQTSRKVYFADNGLRNSVAFKFSSDTGKLLENAVFHHLKQQRKEIYYYQEKQEVDFVVKEGLKITGLINVSSSLEDKETYLRETAALKEGMRYFKQKEATLITLEGKAKTIRDEGFTILIVPFYQWAIADAS